MIEKILGNPHPKPSWTVSRRGQRTHFGPRPWSVLWNKIKQITIISLLLVPSAHALNQYDYKNNVNITNSQLLIGTTEEILVGATKVSTSNYSTTPLGANQVFTGTAEDVSQYSSIATVAFADSTGTLSIQFSPDGTNWDIQEGVGISSGIADRHTHQVIDKWFRFVYTNGNTAQTVFRLNSIFNKFSNGLGTVHTSKLLTKDEDVLLTRDVGNFPLDVSRGLSNYITDVHKFGRNGDVGTGAQEDIWAFGGNYNWLQAPDAIYAYSSDTDDTASGSGARTITVSGLDQNWNSTSTVISMNGTSATTYSTVTFNRVFRAYVEDVGTYTGNNQGNITILTVGGSTVAYVGQAIGQSQLAIYTVPADQDCYITSIHANVDSNKDADVYFWQRQNADDISAPVKGKRLISLQEGVSGDLQFRHDNYAPGYPPKTDIWASSIANTSAASVSVEMELFCVSRLGAPGDPL